MFDDKVNKMLGKNLNEFPQSASNLGFTNKNLNVSPNAVVSRLQKVLDAMPEVKSAKGNLNVEFEDGSKSNVKLLYKEK